MVSNQIQRVERLERRTRELADKQMQEVNEKLRKVESQLAENIRKKEEELENTILSTWEKAIDGGDSITAMRYNMLYKILKN